MFRFAVEELVFASILSFGMEVTSKSHLALSHVNMFYQNV